MSSTGAEWVRAPTEMRSAPAAARVGHRLQGDPAGDLDRDAAIDQLRRRRPPRPGSMLSSEHQVGAGPEGHLHLVEGVALHLDGQGGPAPLGLGDGRLDGDPGQVVVLEQDAVGEGTPVVDAAAGPHRRLLQGPQAGRGLAGVADAGRRPGRVHEPPGQGGDPREVAEQVEGGPLRGEHRRAAARATSGQHLPGLDAVAVGGRPVAPRWPGPRRRTSRAAASRPASTPGGPGHQRRLSPWPSGAPGWRSGRRTRPRSSARARATTSRTAVSGRVHPARRHCPNLCEKTLGRSRGSPRGGARPGSPPGRLPPRSAPGPPPPGWPARPGPGAMLRRPPRRPRPARRRCAPPRRRAVMARCSSSRPLTGSPGASPPRGRPGWRASARRSLPARRRPGAGPGGGRRSGWAPLCPTARPRPPGPRRPCPPAASSRPAGWRRGRRCRPSRRPPTARAGRWRRRGRSARRRRGSGPPGRPAASRGPGRGPGR